MRLKDLFTVPAGQKVTEKCLYRVLVVSICSILLCMSCLVGTTWAWFAVSIENTGNVIQIGKPEIDLTVGGAGYTAGTPLSEPSLVVGMKHANQDDDLNKKSTLYVTLTIQYDGGATNVYTTLDESNSYSAEIHIQNNTEKACSVTWTVSWFAPANAAALTDNTITLAAEESKDPSAPTTTEASAESSTGASTGSAAESSAASTTEAAADAADPSSEPTDDATEPVATASSEEVTDADT